MSRIKHIMILLTPATAFAFLWLIPSACTTVMNSSSGLPLILQQDVDEWSSADFSYRIDRIAIISQLHPEDSVRERAQQVLVLALVHPDNPDPDYKRALDIYRSMIASTAAPAADWRRNLSLLRVIAKLTDETGRLRQELSALLSTHRECVETSKQQQATIKKLQSNIRKLDELLLKVEEKRKRKKIPD